MADMIITCTISVNMEALQKMKMAQIMEMQYKTLRPFAQKVFKMANQRYSRLENADLSFTPALDAVNDGGGKFYISKYPADKAEFLNQLRSETMRAKRFIEMKTSTVSQARKYDAKMKQTLGGEVSRESGSKVWELFRKAEQENFAGIQMYGSDNVAQMIYNSMEDMSDDEVLSYVRDVLGEAYETAEEEMEEALADDFFDLW